MNEIRFALRQMLRRPGWATRAIVPYPTEIRP